MFSGRTVALPDLHTIGACTGKMVAMVSPQGKGIPSAFNWGRVIRHELVHIFNLAQTHYQVPHWLTEGLAVRQEGFPRPPTWNQLLRERAADGAWLDLDNITTAFVRPKNQKEWHQAYCQSLLYVEYVTTTHGKPAIGQLLDAYRDGLGTDAAIRKVLGVEPAAFEKGYRDYLKTVVAGIKGGEVERDPKTLTQLEADHEKNPDDPDIAARLAEALLKRGKKREARQLVETVLDAKPGHPLASVLKARLLEEAGDTDGAIGVLEKALTDSPDPRVLRALGRSAFEAKQFDKAAKWLEQGRTAEPNDPAWLQDLAKVYGQTGEDAKLAAVLADLAPLDADDVVTRKKLAALLVAAEDWPKAEAAAREALEIDVTDGDVQNLLLEALKQQPAKAEEHARLRTLFAPGKAD
jgi:tetratricopeptide (TPR) repeat protein